MAATAVFVATMGIAHCTESILGARSWTSANLDFSGAALREGKVWVPVSSSFVHHNWAHFSKQVTFLVIAGPYTEMTLGLWWFCFIYITGGALGCVLSWRILRHRLLSDPSYLSETNNNRSYISFIADNSPSRGASACTYALAAAAIFAKGSNVAHTATQVWVLCAAPFGHLLCSKNGRCRLWKWRMHYAAFIFLAAISTKAATGEDRIKVFVLNWYFAAMFRRALERKPQGCAALDWESHASGAFFGAAASLCASRSRGGGGNLALSEAIPFFVLLYTAVFNR